MRAISFLAPVAFCAAAGAAALISCADALHLDPPADGGATTGGHVDGGGCQSSVDCAYPKPACDTEIGMCVECVSASDCTPGTVCSKGKCGCPTPTDTPCGDAIAVCVDTQTSTDNCGSCGHACFGSCVGGKCSDAWEPVPTEGAPSARSHHVAAWTGSEMFVWGGTLGNGKQTSTGGLYDPAKHTWRAVSPVNAPSPRADATAVWDDTDKLVIVWGGTGTGGLLQTGGVFDPAKNTWTAMSIDMAPSARTGYSAVWAPQLPGVSKGMIVWGGDDGSGGKLGNGAIFTPMAGSAGTWSPLVPPDPTMGPWQRAQHGAIWDSDTSQMIIVGGNGPTMGMGIDAAQADVGIFAPGGGNWTDSTPGTFPGRYAHTAVYDTTTMSPIIWGGLGTSGPLSDGAKLTLAGWVDFPGTDPTAVTPEARSNHTAVVVVAGGKSQMLVFGGAGKGGVRLDTAWSLDIAMTTWSPLPSVLSARYFHTAVSTGSTMIVWGGDTDDGATNTGAVYNAGP